MTDRVQAAINEIYRCFSDARCPASIELSPVKDPEDYRVLIQTPLRELQQSDLFGYAHAVFYTVGGQADFEYLFPRLLELVTEDFCNLPREVVFSKVALAGWINWRPDRQLAFRNYCEAVMASFAIERRPDDELDSWICALAHGQVPLDIAFKALLSGTDAADGNLIAFYESNSAHLLKHNTLGNPFWNHELKVHQSVVEWLQAESVVTRIETIYNVH